MKKEEEEEEKNPSHHATGENTCTFGTDHDVASFFRNTSDVTNDWRQVVDEWEAYNGFSCIVISLVSVLSFFFFTCHTGFAAPCGHLCHVWWMSETQGVSWVTQLTRRVEWRRPQVIGHLTTWQNFRSRQRRETMHPVDCSSYHFLFLLLFLLFSSLAHYLLPLSELTDDRVSAWQLL